MVNQSGDSSVGITGTIEPTSKPAIVKLIQPYALRYKKLINRKKQDKQPETQAEREQLRQLHRRQNVHQRLIQAGGHQQKGRADSRNNGAETDHRPADQQNGERERDPAADVRHAVQAENERRRRRGQRKSQKIPGVGILPLPPYEKWKAACQPSAR